MRTGSSKRPKSTKADKALGTSQTSLVRASKARVKLGTRKGARFVLYIRAVGLRRPVNRAFLVSVVAGWVLALWGSAALVE